MKKVIALLIVLAAAGVAALALMAFHAEKPPAGEQIAWSDFERGTQFAREKNLPMMIDFVASWCIWCKKMAEEVYPAPEVVRLSQKFVCIRVDADREEALVQHYKVDGYPTIVFTNSMGEEVHRITGYVSANEFIAQMKATLETVGGGK